MNAESEVEIVIGSKRTGVSEKPIVKVVLKPAEECVGFYRGIKVSGEDIAFVLSLTNGQILHVSFPKGAREEEIIRTSLHKGMIGKKVGIARIDDNLWPISIRKIQREVKSDA